MKKLHKYNLINIAILFLGILLGILIIVSYQHIKEKKTAVERDTYVYFLNETSLLINKNQALHQEIVELTEDINENKTGYLAYQNAEETIEKLKMILGEEDVAGEGVKIYINKELPYYVLIDIITDFKTIEQEELRDGRSTGRNPIHFP